MNCLFKYRGRLLYFLATLIVSTFVFGCRQSEKVEKFDASVFEAVQLDSTEIGLSTIISDLVVPWDIEWGPDGQIWYTIQDGTVNEVDPHTGKETTLLDIKNKVYTRTTPGLLGMAIYHQKAKKFVFLTYTHKTKKDKITLRLERYTIKKDTLTDPLILKEIPGGKSHNGSRIAISPKGKVFWATGDLADNKNAQDTASLNGKVLRFNMDGSIPEDNPFPGSPVWAMGFRAPEGLAFAPDGKLFLSTNGPATDDEINIIKRGGRYRWPLLNDEDSLFYKKHKIISPLKDWTPTVAPSGIAFYHSDKIPEWNNSLLVTTLKGSSLRILKLNQTKDSVIDEKIFFEDRFGRLRDVCVSPSGDIYMATSNKDWKKAGKGQPNDDRIIRIAKIDSSVDNLTKVNVQSPTPLEKVLTKPLAIRNNGKSLYQSYCSTCHRIDGSGSPGVFPALNKNELVRNKKILIAITLNGDKSIPKKFKTKSGQEMPSFNFLKDEQVANILTYIRTSWDNDAGKISKEDVGKMRSKN